MHFSPEPCNSCSGNVSQCQLSLKCVFFLPEDLCGEQGVWRQVLREDLVVVNKVLGGLLKLGSSCDAR